MAEETKAIRIQKYLKEMIRAKGFYIDLTPILKWIYKKLKR